MPTQSLERNQVFIYFAAIVGGLTVGAAVPESRAIFEAMLWPALGLLLYATFTQVPLWHLRAAVMDRGFFAAAVVGNFALLPVFVWLLLFVAPDDAAIRLGVAMVLLVPCTDWFITFTDLGGGDTSRAIAFSPVSLLLQLILLPAYLWAFFGEGFAVTFARGEIVTAFLSLILTPLSAAFLTEKWARSGKERSRLIGRLGALPVPLLALVVFAIAASQVSLVMKSGLLLARLLVLFAAFLVIAAALAHMLARSFQLPPKQGRVLAFSFGTRNSFVVLPLALALPPSFEPAVVAIVFQSLVELFGMLAYLRWVPKILFPERP